MTLRAFSALFLSLAVLAGCGANDLDEAPVPLGDFALGLNVVFADNVKKIPISREATVEELETAMKKAIEERFGRYQGTKLYNFGISVDTYALAPPGIPLIASPKSALVVTATLWDDAAQAKLNEEGKQFTVFEGTSAESAVLGSGLTRTKEEQLERLTRNAAKEIERWMVQNPAWFGLTDGPAPVAAATAPLTATTGPGAPAQLPQTPAPEAAVAPVAAPDAGGVTTTPLPPVAAN